jgi:hypothetical protein
MRMLLKAHGEETWPQCGAGGSGPGHAEDDLCDVDEAGEFRPIATGLPGQRPGVIGH